MTGTLLEEYGPGFVCVRLEDGRESRVICPMLGLDVRRPPALPAGTRVQLEYDGLEDAYWATRILPGPSHA